MEFKEFVQLKEAPAPKRTAMSSHQDGEDNSDDKKIPQMYMSMIGQLSSRIQKFFEGQKKSNNIAKPKIERLGLDTPEGARGLATMFARIFHDAFTASGKRLSLRDPNAMLEIKNLIKTRLGEGKNILYPLIFVLGRSLLDDDYDEAKTGSNELLSALDGVVGDIDSEGNSLRKNLEAIDRKYRASKENTGSRSSDRLQKNINDRFDNIIVQKMAPTDLMFTTQDEYLDTYFPDARKGNEDKQFAVFEKALIDAVEKEQERLKAGGKARFIRGSEVDEVVKDFSDYVLNAEDEELISDFVDSVIENSIGHVSAIPSQWRTTVNDMFPELGKDISKRIKHAEGDRTTDDTQDSDGRRSEAQKGMAAFAKKSTVSGGDEATDGDIDTFLSGLNKDIKTNTKEGNPNSLRHLLANTLKGKIVTPEQLSKITKTFDDIVRTESIPRFTMNAAINQLHEYIKVASPVASESTKYRKFLESFEERIVK